MGWWGGGVVGWWGGGVVGGVTATIATTKIGPGFEFLQKLVPGSNPQKVDTFFFS